MNLSRLAIKYSKATIAFWLSIAIAGILALSSLQYNLFPEVTFPVVIVRAESNNLNSAPTAEATEVNVTIPLESALTELAGLTDIESTSYPKQAILSLVLEPGMILAEAETMTQQIIKQVELPNTKLKVIPLNLNESTAVSYVLTSDRLTLAELSNIASDQILPKLEKLSDVQKIERLGDLQASKTLVRFNGKNAIALKIIKTAEGNTLEVVKQVAQTIKQLQPQFPDVRLEIAETQAKYIREATQATIESLLGAVVISVLTIFGFLRSWRATLIAAIAIPLSLLGTFIVMAIAGFDLETLTLLALALVIGIIVDDAIVEVENIMRHQEQGNSPGKAALLATQEIGFTVSVSTLTIVAVFLPIALMGGTLGKFFRPFGLTISVAVLTSLLVARTLVPVLATYFLKPRLLSSSTRELPNFPLSNLKYRRLLSWSLSHRWQVIVIALVISLGGIALIPLIPQGFVPDLDRGEFNVYYQTPLPEIRINRTPQEEQVITSSNFSWLQRIARSPEQILLRRTLNIGNEIETKILALPEVASAYTVVGVREQPNLGKIYLKLQPERQLTTNQVQEKVRHTLSDLPNISLSVEDIPFVETGSDTPFKLALEGNNLEQVQKTAQQLKIKLEELNSLVDLTISGANQALPSITRLNRQRVIYLSANLAPGVAIGDVTQEVNAIAGALLPAEIRLNTQGDSARAGKILGEFALTLSIAIVLMLGILYLPFRRWLEPLVIGLALPLAIIGAMLALLVTQSDFGMISLMGLIFLLGLLDKNGVLLMDYANQLRNKGMARKDALIETGAVRLRPILMTTASTVLGMLPIALGFGAGSELRQPMAVAIIGGLLASSVLSLVVIPVLYSLLEDWLGSRVK